MSCVLFAEFKSILARCRDHMCYSPRSGSFPSLRPHVLFAEIREYIFAEIRSRTAQIFESLGNSHEVTKKGRRNCAHTVLYVL